MVPSTLLNAITQHLKTNVYNQDSYYPDPTSPHRLIIGHCLITHTRPPHHLQLHRILNRHNPPPQPSRPQPTRQNHPYHHQMNHLLEAIREHLATHDITTSYTTAKRLHLHRPGSNHPQLTRIAHSINHTNDQIILYNPHKDNITINHNDPELLPKITTWATKLCKLATSNKPSPNTSKTTDTKSKATAKSTPSTQD